MGADRMLICGTGHRPNKLGGYSNEARCRLVDIAEAWLIENKPEKVISGMALGWDQALAHATFRLDPELPFIAAVPFKGQESRWPQESRKDYQDLIRDAAEIVYVCDEGYAVWKMQKRNEWMVDNSDLILAMWDGSSGGTANCIKYAKSKNKPIVNLWEYYNKDNDGESSTTVHSCK